MRCQFCVMTPPELFSGGLVLDSFRPYLLDALSTGLVQSVLLRNRGADEQAIVAAIDSLRDPAQSAGAAFLIEDRADLVMSCGCDGVELAAKPTTLRAVRQALGRDLIVGAECGGSRHLAMVAGEAEVDYVRFDAAAVDTVAWWADLMEVPCIAAGGITLESAPELIEAGADFLALGSAVWNHPRGPAAALQAFAALAAEAD